jgi:YD repeat-containing protein
VQTFNTYQSAINDHIFNPSSSGALSFIINMPQVISIDYGRDIGNYLPNGSINNNNIVKIYLAHGDSAAAELVFTSKKLGKPVETGTDTVTLQRLGTYFYVVYCDSQAVRSYGGIRYQKIVTVPNAELGYPGPGLRIKTISSFDNSDSATPSLVKNYSYSGGISLSSNTLGFSTISHHNEWGIWTEQIYTADYSSPLFTLINDQIYYSMVSETNGAGRSVYEYGADGVDALGVFLKKQSDYAFKDSNYVLLKEKINTYESKSIINLWAFTCNLSQIVDDPSCDDCPGIVMILPLESDVFDTTYRYKLYEAHPYVLSSEYLRTISTDEISYDQNGQNPLTVQTNYYYDNPNHLQPTRLITTNSKGDSIITETKYAMDYNFISCGSLYSIDTTFISARRNASIAYQACVQARKNAAYFFFNSNIKSPDNTSFKSALRNYSPNCENVYRSTCANALNTMNMSITNYYNCLATAGIPGFGLTNAQQAIVLLQAYHQPNVPVEQIVSIKKGNIEYLLDATKTDFTVNSLYTILPKIIYKAELATTLKSSFMANPGNYYKPRVNFAYDQFANIVEQSRTSDVKMSYVWDYKSMYPTAQVTGASVNDIAYTSFEADGKGGWTYSGPSANYPAAPTGNKVYNLFANPITKTGLNSATTYIITYWKKSGINIITVNGANGQIIVGKNGWTLYRHEIIGSSSITISGNAIIDELRLYPKGALMTTYTYDPLIGSTSSASPNSILSYYEYDPLGRLKALRDADGKIIKRIDYKYQGTYHD